MNKRLKQYIIALAALVMTFTANAQGDRQAAFEHSIDFIKCKCTEIIYGINLSCETDPAIARVEQYAARHPRTGTLMGELERLKQTQVASWSTDSIAQLLSTGIFQSNNRSTYPQSYNFSVNRGRNTDGTMNTLGEAIGQYVQNQIPDLPTAEDLAIMQDSLIEAELPPALIPDGGILVEEEHAENDSPQSLPFFSFQLNIAHLLLAALAVLVSWLLINRVRRDYENQINNLKFKIDGKAEASELAKVENDLKLFTDKLEAARKKRLAEKQAKAVSSVPRPLSVEKVLYLPAPHSDGAFRTVDESTKFQPSKSIYRFKIDPTNPNLATFTFHSDNMGFQHATDNPAVYIRPVCQETNPIHPGAKQVATTKPGLATKKGDRWIVADNQKAVIRYE